jgi:hypothetical protein
MAKSIYGLTQITVNYETKSIWDSMVCKVKKATGEQWFDSCWGKKFFSTPKYPNWL